MVRLVCVFCFAFHLVLIFYLGKDAEDNSEENDYAPRGSG